MSHTHTSAAAAPIETVPPPTWLVNYRHSYPGTRDQVRRGRKALRCILADQPRLDDAVTVGSELASNAIEHSRSGEPDGVYTLYASVSTTLGATYVAVEDAGGEWGGVGVVVPRHEFDVVQDVPEHGRGLNVVESLAGPQNWGIGGGARGRLVWAYLLWPGHSTGELEVTLMTADGDDPCGDLRKLAGALDPLGLAAELLIPAGQGPRLAVHVAGRPGFAVNVYAQADWYLLPTAERLALREDESRAAAAIARYLGVDGGTGND